MSLRLRLLSRSLRRSLQRSLPAAVLLGLGLSSLGCGQQATATVTATWTLVAATEPDPQAAKPRPCSDFGATTVRIQVTPGGAIDFPCTDYHGATMTMPAGYYTIQVIAFGSFGKVLSSLEFREKYAYGTTNLGELRFAVR
jgi:hypothetical protein